MTIYVTRKQDLTPPAWDKSGEKRVMMSHKEKVQAFGPPPWGKGKVDKYLTHPVTDPAKPGAVGATPRAKQPRSLPVTVEPKLVAKLKKEFQELLDELGPGKRCEAFRTLVHLNDELTVNTFIAALPEMNPSTARIQFRKSHAIIKELDGKVAGKKRKVK